MTDVLPQQQLLLELLVMSGRNAVPKANAEGILWRTLNECEQNGCLLMKAVNADYASAEVTDTGRSLVRQTGRPARGGHHGTIR